MLQLYDVNKNKLYGLTEYKNLRNERTLDGDEVLSFSYPQNNSKYDSIKEECYIRTEKNEYVIKEIDIQDDWTEFVAKVNVEELKGTVFSHFETVEQSCSNSIDLALAGTGWTIGSCNANKLRTVRKSNCSSWDILQEIRKTYFCDFKFDAINKKIYIYQSMGSDKGSYFSEELNLKKIGIQGNSYDFCTRIIPLGKERLGIADVNSGVDYVENYQYSNKVITVIWEDNRYTDAESLKEDAILKLDELSKPVRAYSAEVIDLAKLNDKYTEILDYDLGDTITLLSKDKKVKEKQRIVKLIEYPDDPELNSCELANRILKFEDVQAETQDAVDTVNSVTTSDGQIDGSKIDGIDYAKIKNVSIQTADIQDASITTAKIGNLQVTGAKIANATITTANIALAAIGTAQIQNGAITNALIGIAAVNTAQIADGSITDAKIVELTAEKITAGTLSVERLEIRGSTNSIVYELNNISGALQSQNVDTLNGEIVTPRTITADKIVANSITAAEIAAKTIVANNIAANTITAAEIAAGTITGDKIAANTITATNISAGAITVDKIASNVGSSLDLSSNESVKIAVGQIGGMNYVRDSDFASASPYTPPPSWSVWGSNTWVYEQQGISPYNVAGTLYLANDSATIPGGASTWVGVKPNTLYVFSAQARKESNVINGRFYMKYYNNGAYVSTVYMDIDLDDIRHSVKFTTPSNFTDAYLGIKHYGSTNETGGYLFIVRYLQIEEGDNATAWKPNSNEINTLKVIINSKGLTVKDSQGSSVIAPEGIDAKFITVGEISAERMIYAGTPVVSVHTNNQTYNGSSTPEVFQDSCQIHITSGSSAICTADIMINSGLHFIWNVGTYLPSIQVSTCYYNTVAGIYQIYLDGIGWVNPNSNYNGHISGVRVYLLPKGSTFDTTADIRVFVTIAGLAY